MRVVIQRVKEASVSVQGVKISEIQKGLLILVGVETQDTQQDIDWLVAKVAKLRIFEDPLGAMNVSLQDIDADVIVVSQFTLHASTKKGNRPSFIKAAKPEVAIPLYQEFVDSLEKQLDKKIQTGQFGAMMDVALINDGPVTITIDSKNKE
ncbi:D-aminoacyl-tRNA deacylase [bacterium]|jgi:D-tyrosyl-tRNA(Tyr) deacylase|nr:D-aminoacyl-tRNA deacylase [Flavobacteriaceae bacterium]MDA9319867.1 D-aminoacyl-tRNA deacylase [bacterium]